ncbi:MAG: LPS export ABC transporter permease LptF [Deltaproteobacteria bacterium]|jgi:lipopolysaccharide export system permease protein|nr:LPS export ABC transporter permease LptF [Deltaproteobacteria bacterium]
MKLNSIVNRYVLKEMLAPFCINVLVFTFLFLMTELIKITNWIVNYNLSIFSVLTLIFFSMPWFLMFIIPMSVMLAVVLTFLRMSADNEIVALKSCGLSVSGLLPSVFIFSFAGFLLTLFMTLYGVPKAKATLEDMVLEMAASNVDIGLKERTFNDAFKNVMMYVNKIDLNQKKLIDIFIEDKRQRNIISTVVAPEGRLFSEPGKFVFHLVLSNGTIHQTNLKEHSANSIRFDTYKLSLDLKKEMEKAEEREKGREEMSIAELKEVIEKESAIKDKDYYKAQIVIHRRFSFPVACLALGLLAFPLGIQSKSGKRSSGLILCLFFFLIYYLLLTAGYTLGKKGIYPPVIGMWLPNLTMASIGLYFLFQTTKERTLKIERLLQRIVQLFARLHHFKHVHHR